MIDKKEFIENLKLTQNYCEDKIKDNSKNLASILRTINPVINGKQIFYSEITQFDYSNIGSLSLNRWNLNERQDYTDIVLDLFNKQLSIKRETNKTSNTEFNGRILVSEYESSVIDGASEVQAEGLIDIYDLTPIDTWFYIDNRNNLLFSWIPEKYVDLINEAVLVNCIDMLKWMDIDYKNIYLSIFDKELLIENSTDNFLTTQSLKEKLKKRISTIFNGQKK
jgi:hypothetical protein